MYNVSLHRIFPMYNVCAVKFLCCHVKSLFLCNLFQPLDIELGSSISLSFLNFILILLCNV